MLTKPYGRTGKQIPVIGFGGMRFETPGDIDASAALVRYAYDKGVRYFDTAPSYCQGNSEIIMGRGLAGLNRDDYFISTKSGKPSGDAVRKDLEQSLQKMNIDQIDFFHIWCVVTLDEWKERVQGGAVAAAIKAKEEGLVKHLAISSHLRGNQLAEVLKQAPFEGVLLGYCAINFPYRQVAIDSAGEMGLGVVTMNPLGGGLIPQNAQRLDFIRSPQDKTVVEAALRFNISHPAVTCALVGFSNTQHIDQACQAVQDFTPYPVEHLEQVQEKILSSFNDLCTGCGYCLPCPKGIKTPQMMDVYNQLILSGGDTQSVLNRLKWHWNVCGNPIEECVQCGLCEKRCTQHLPVQERLQEIAQIVSSDRSQSQ